MPLKIEKKIHRGYKEFEKARKKVIISQLFGKWQYNYSSEKGKISLINLKNRFKEGDSFWEILSFKGNLFAGAERFNTKKEAEKRIKELL